MHTPGFSLQGAARWTAGGGALLGLAGIVLSQTVFAPKHEVFYSSGVSAAHCAEVEGRRECSFFYQFSLGNTGKLEQDALRIEWPLDLRAWSPETQVSDIVGSAKKTPRPQILPAFEADRTVYTVTGLMPNTMIRLNASCLACTPEQLQAMRQTQPHIAARGAVHEGEPRVSALRRGAVNVLRLLGLFF